MANDEPPTLAAEFQAALDAVSGLQRAAFLAIRHDVADYPELADRLSMTTDEVGWRLRRRSSR